MSLRSSFEAKVLLAFGTAMLVVLVLFAITWRLADGAAEAALQVEQTQQALHALAQVRTTTLQAELSTQNFRITGDEQHLAERDTALAQREQTLRSLKRLTQGDPAQQERWTALRTVVNERIALTRQIEAARRNQGAAVASVVVAAAPLKETRVRTHRLIDAMEADERLLLEQHSAERDRTGRLIRPLGAAVTALLLAQLISTYLILRRQLRAAAGSRRDLEDSEERLSITLRSIGEAVTATDVDGRVSRMNPVAERLTGWPSDEAIGRPVHVVFRATEGVTGSPLGCPVGEVLQSGEPQVNEGDVLLLARGGDRCPIALSATPKRDMQGRLRGAVLVFRDVTLERQAQRSIEAQNAALAERVQERTAHCAKARPICKA
ncbi:CHASE3 domain-containing protein [Pelomonas sp. Root1217]|uniref:CHASE3 domain-containing protein n=1 Tax=Pelomonas sp. Root1217 TaxID=1736430 RepID=UPI000A880DBE|nr:CHASE3 domain-containing protein [Pelomonas sp. Root1217]